RVPGARRGRSGAVDGVEQIPEERVEIEREARLEHQVRHGSRLQSGRRSDQALVRPRWCLFGPISAASDIGHCHLDGLDSLADPRHNKPRASGSGYANHYSTISCWINRLVAPDATMAADVVVLPLRRGLPCV